MPDGVEEHGGTVACHGFRGEQRAADRLAHHGQDRVPLRDHQGSPFELDDAGWGWQWHAEAFLGASRELIARCVVAGVDDALAVRARALRLPHRAPQHPLPAAPIRRERVEEPDAVGHPRP